MIVACQIIRSPRQAAPRASAKHTAHSNLCLGRRKNLRHQKRNWLWPTQLLRQHKIRQPPAELLGAAPKDAARRLSDVRRQTVPQSSSCRWHRGRPADGMGERNSRDLRRLDDDPVRVLLAFLSGADRRLSPQGISMFALDYYSPWLGGLVPQLGRLGRLEVRCDPRDISHIYIRDPETKEFRAVERRDGLLAPIEPTRQKPPNPMMRCAHRRRLLPSIRCVRNAVCRSRIGDMADHLLDHVRPHLDRSVEDRIAYI